MGLTILTTLLLACGSAWTMPSALPSVYLKLDTDGPAHATLNRSDLWEPDLSLSQQGHRRSLKQAAGSRQLVQNTLSFPYSSIGAILFTLKNGNTGLCTGAVINGNTLLTAAHCAYDVDTGSTLASGFFFPGWNPATDSKPGSGKEGGWALTGTQYPSAFSACGHSGYTTCHQSWDVAVMYIKTSSGNSGLPYMSIGYDNSLSSSETINTAGYPGTGCSSCCSSSTSVCYMYTSYCPTTTFSELQAYGIDNCLSSPGQSGSPMWFYSSGPPVQRMIVGILTFGPASGSSAFTGYTVITQNLFNNLMTWMTQAPSS